MSTLVYKRTHSGDPDEQGIFGHRDCMGQVRGYEFDSVIGIGGIGNDAKWHEIDGEINWIGIGAHAVGRLRGNPLLGFEHFVLFESDGLSLKKVAKNLARRFLHPKGPRYVIDGFSPEEHAEIEAILKTARRKPPSPGLFQSADKKKTICKPRRTC